MTLVRQLLVLHVKIMLVLVHATQVVLHVILAVSLLPLYVHIFDILVIGLRRDEQSVGLVLLILLHLFTTDVRAFFEYDSDQVLQPQHITSVKSA